MVRLGSLAISALRSGEGALRAEPESRRSVRVVRANRWFNFRFREVGLKNRAEIRSLALGANRKSLLREVDRQALVNTRL
jgi:hypothetical protein